MLKPLLIFTMLLGTVQFGQAQYLKLNIPVTNSADDAEESGSNGTGGAGVMDITSSDLEFTLDGSTRGNQWIGIRFRNVQIPQGATIYKAYVQFSVDEIYTNTANVVIKGEAADNAAAYSASAFNISSRSSTIDSVSWTIPHWGTVDQAGIDQQTPDLKNIVQNIVNRSGWNKGNALNLLITGTGRRNAHAYDGSAAKAPILVIEYLPSSFEANTLPMNFGSLWKYHDKGTNLDSSWRKPGYIDTSWAFGPGNFGYGDPANMPLSFGADANNKYPTYYFRNILKVSNPGMYDSLIFNLKRDDGAVIYLNGKEIYRSNMPAGTLSYSTLASSNISGAAESAVISFTIDNTLLTDTNWIYAEVHQDAVTSSDLNFDLEVLGKLPPLAVGSFPISRLSDWSYMDNGSSLDAIQWKDSTYDDNGWRWGKAPLGYGDPVNTVISYGPNAAFKYITAYFRKEIWINDTSSINADSLYLGLRRDDGALVYINGQEVVRSNMPAGAIDYLTKSSTIVDGSAESAYNSFGVPKTTLRNGLNVIAVELHQRDSSSSDTQFDLELLPYPKVSNTGYGCQPGKEGHISCFSSVTPSAQTAGNILPATHTFQLILKQGETYKNASGTGTVPGGHDFTGYAPDNGSSTKGTVAVNHENNPGAVSLVDVRYVDSLQIWMVDSSMATDFSALVKTERNCSGGVTPWGTIITSEETFNTTDANSDGYADVGWNVEIDPKTRKIPDYGTGSPQKLWAMGRMSHENVVVANDSITCYYGEDGGTQCVYKFVADAPGNLSSGKLYVLKLDNPLVSGEPSGTTATWVQVPNTTQSERNNTNSLASGLGGTNFNGVEDCEINPINGMIYFTSKGLSRVYRFQDNGSTISNFETFVGGPRNYFINTGTSVASEAWGSGNDNLTFDDLGNLWVLQDGSRNHFWMVAPNHTQIDPKVELFNVTPAGSEPTGMTFTPDHKFMFVSYQHPSGSNATNLTDAAGNTVRFNGASTVVIARKEVLGATKPVAGFSANKLVVAKGDTVTFSDTSLFKPTQRTWYFQDANIGSILASTPMVSWDTTGTFAVKLVVSNAAGMDSIEKVAYITVTDQKPLAAFNASKTNITPGEQVTFTSSSTGVIDTYRWEFAGGTPATATTANPVVTYNNPGSYTVKLVVSNSGGADSVIKTNHITVQVPKPQINFVASQYTLTPGTTVTFTDNSTNNPTTHTWSFPGGTPATASTANPSVTYNTPGVYDVTLTAGNAGGSNTRTRYALIRVDALSGVQQIENLADFSLYPNPVQKELMFDLNLLQDNLVEVTLIDLSGKQLQLLAPVSLKAGQHQLQLDLSKHGLSKGVYTIRIKIGAREISQQIIKS